MTNEEKDALIGAGLRESIQLLKLNLRPAGILAATSSDEAERRNYTTVFGRDAAICALGMALSGEPDLVEGARQGLLTLSRHQAENGQLPKFVDPEEKEADFWYVGCIDATLWWLIAIRLMQHYLNDEHLFDEVAIPIKKAIGWLHCQEHPRLHLLQQNEASDWADIMPRSGFVLYSNALWFYVKKLYGLPHIEETKYHFNHLFYPFSRDIPDYRRVRLLTHYIRNRTKGSALYLSFVNFSFWGDEGDVFGNLLAVLFGLADAHPARRIVRTLENLEAERPWPIRSVCFPISQESELWRPYMGRHQQNIEDQYHNGGAWPFIGGFWVLALRRVGEQRLAESAMLKLAEVNRVENWGFFEWFHGRTGDPRGMRGQSWNAAMFLLAHSGETRTIF